MSLYGVLKRFATGVYTVTRTPARVYVDGYLTSVVVPSGGYLGEYEGPYLGLLGGNEGSGDEPSTFTTEAVVQPANGAALKLAAEGQRAEDIRVVYTPVELRSRRPGFDPDVIEIDGEPFAVYAVQGPWTLTPRHHTHWNAYVARQVIP